MITLVLPDPIATRIQQLAELEVESGGVLLVREVRDSSGNRRLLARDLVEVPDTAYERRESDLLQISSEGYVPALGLAEADRSIALWFHTHPGEGSSPVPSVHDREVDNQLRDVFRLRATTETYGALVVGRSIGHLTFVGHLDDGVNVLPIDRLLTVGDRLRLELSADTEEQSLGAAYDRNVRALGGATQRALGHLRVSIIGCGGTGSAVAEQLVRLGVRSLQLIDPDDLSESNITRVYGSTPEDIGTPKVSVLRQHLLDIAPDASIDVRQSMLTVEATARSLIGSDVIFGCTDDNAGRLVLSRLSTYLLVPVIDCGIIVSSDAAGHIDGINGRVTVLSPGAACLVCRGRIDMARAASELLTPEERRRRVDEGYAPALGGVEPAVVTFTTAVAAAAVSELIERMTGYGPDPVPSEVLLRLHDREMSTNIAEPRVRHYCHRASGKQGAGLTEPFLEQTWRA